MLTDYIRAALCHGEYKQLEDGSWFAEIPGFEGVWANAASVEACRTELAEVLEEWLLLKIHDHDPLPVVDGHDLAIAWDSAA
ncbi:MAG: type II toxin-antitoxin system HicB family antitoxin [Thiohalocapsa sp.]|jgi:predicted RNase H-like HicB family nuclease|uniref:type II toxin-antitoxin system HicB family antitoxin n=1 Tax=Thiohalocapsa sp. TaxID=2497641 RepID=UPI0025FA647B|nr:type II toxin-antitoxin system HicB family antitoxin [Thiohalocapsa sp.]MCG6941351.1 type II toxin-antitoxin system HicB family antitoxin [Thiohalocapsa sp.]